MMMNMPGDRSLAETVLRRSLDVAPGMVVILCCSASLFLSILESRINFDVHHWGLMYVNAADLNHGLVPYREIFIQYGFLTTLLQSVAIAIFGDSVVSVGIITGIFYSISIFLSYLLLAKIIGKWLSALAAAVMFLVHGYSIYPWSNYFAYTLLLVALSFLLLPSPKGRWYLLAGIFCALSFLARQTAVSVLPPVYLFFGILCWKATGNSRKLHLRNICIFHAGMLGVLGSFLLFLCIENAFADWVRQSFSIANVYSTASGGVRYWIKTFLRGVFLAEGWHYRDARLKLYSLVFLNAFVMWVIVVRRLLREKGKGEDLALLLLSTTVLCGYLQAFHIYEIFRLQNGSSLGIGLLFFSMYFLARKLAPFQHAVFGIPVVILITKLSMNFLFVSTSSVYNPWDRHLLFSGQLREPRDIAMLRGKLYDKDRCEYYESLAAILKGYRSRLPYIVNLSSNSYVPLLVPSLKRVQRIPFYCGPGMDEIVPHEREDVDKLLAAEKAICVSAKPDQVPDNYRIIFEKKDPEIYVSVPQLLADAKP